YDGQSALILDHAGCALEHGLPQDDRLLSLEDGATRVVPNQERHEASQRSTSDDTGPTEEPSSLVEISPERIAAMKAELERLCAIARERGYRLGWAYHRFRARFGHAPPVEMMALVRAEEIAAPPCERPPRPVRSGTRALLQLAITQHGGHLSWDQ